MNNTAARPAPAQSTLEMIYRIIEQNHPDHRIPENMHPAQGQFVLTGPRSGPVNHKIGYCVQVRKGELESDRPTVLLRHADGSVSAQPHPCLFALSAEQEVLARRIFNSLPRDEKPEQGYTCSPGCVCTDPTRKFGFIVPFEAPV